MSRDTSRKRVLSKLSPLSLNLTSHTPSSSSVLGNDISDCSPQPGSPKSFVSCVEVEQRFPPSPQARNLVNADVSNTSSSSEDTLPSLAYVPLFKESPEKSQSSFHSNDLTRPPVVESVFDISMEDIEMETEDCREELRNIASMLAESGDSENVYLSPECQIVGADWGFPGPSGGGHGVRQSDLLSGGTGYDSSGGKTNKITESYIKPQSDLSSSPSGRSQSNDTQWRVNRGGYSNIQKPLCPNYLVSKSEDSVGQYQELSSNQKNVSKNIYCQEGPASPSQVIRLPSPSYHPPHLTTPDVDLNPRLIAPGIVENFYCEPSPLLKAARNTSSESTGKLVSTSSSDLLAQKLLSTSPSSGQERSEPIAKRLKPDQKTRTQNHNPGQTQTSNFSPPPFTGRQNSSSHSTAWTIKGFQNNQNTSNSAGSSQPTRPREGLSLFSPSPDRQSLQSQKTPSVKETIQSSNEEVEETFLSVFFGCGQLGAALYNTATCKLQLMQDIPDLSPNHEMLCSLIYQEQPTYVLVSARQDQSVLDVLSGLSGEKSADSDTSQADTSGDSRLEAAFKRITVIKRPSMDFGSRSGRLLLLGLDVPGGPTESDQDQLLKLSAFVDFSSDNMVRAAGALLRYLQRNRPGGLDLEISSSGVLFIDSLVLGEILTMDEAAFSSLQIFSSTRQLSGSTAGSWNKAREGMSLFNLLNRCCSVVGSRFMRYMLRCPSTNLDVLANRQQAVEFFTDSSHLEFIHTLGTSLRQIKNFHRIMKKMAGNTASVSDWQSLLRTLTGLVQLADLGARVNISILTEVKEAVKKDIFSLCSLMEQVIDFQASLASGNLSVKPGVDERLDEKRRLHNALPDLLSAVAQEEAKHLPAPVQVCTVCYLPQVGYLIAIPSKEELVKRGFNYRDIPGLEFVFESNGAVHYRNSRTLSLDDKMGDVVMDITSLELRILGRLTDMVLVNRVAIERAVSLCGQLDCLLAMARVSKENNWSKPTMVREGHLAVRGGRHPLQEQSVSQFIANDTALGGAAARVHLLTGPNSSGKSVYIKQVGLIVFLAHLGCWVPAEAANIPLTDRILTRIQTVESVSLGMSSFLCDVNQVSMVLRTSSARSLLLVDEFGKGTSSVDGQALLASVIQELLDRGPSSPLCLLSTHFHQVVKILSPQPGLDLFKMETKVSDTDLLYLYKLVKGVSEYSEARAVALKAGIASEVVDRADMVQERLAKGQVIPQESVLPMAEIHRLVTAFLEVDLEQSDQVSRFLEKVNQITL